MAPVRRDGPCCHYIFTNKCTEFVDYLNLTGIAFLSYFLAIRDFEAGDYFRNVLVLGYDSIVHHLHLVDLS